MVDGDIQTSLLDRPVGLVVSDPDCKAGGRGFDSHPGQTLCDEHNCLFCVWV